MRRVGSVIGRISDLIGSIVITGVIVFVDVIIRRSVIIMGNIRTSIIILGGICIRGGCVRTSGIIRGIVVIIAVLGIDRKSGILRFGLLLGFCSAAVSGASLKVLVARARRTLASLGDNSIDHNHRTAETCSHDSNFLSRLCIS